MNMATIKNKFHNIVLRFINVIQYPLFELFCRNRIYVLAYANRVFNYTIKNNWGDDLNFDFIEKISRKRLIKYEFSLLSRFRSVNTYSFIGSILEYVVITNPKSIVWGTGFKFSTNNFTYNDLNNLNIRAVRGPRTREIFLSKGIECPKVFGDPALLLSLFYKPVCVKKKYKIGLVPHKDDCDNIYIKKLAKNENTKVISLKCYDSWTGFIDEICSCEVILSTSLHGLIVSDSYKIPNIWISVSDAIEGGDFKFYDYFEGVSKHPQKLVIDDSFIIENIYQYVSLWEEPKISTDFIRSCPFNIAKMCL